MTKHSDVNNGSAQQVFLNQKNGTKRKIFFKKVYNVKRKPETASSEMIFWNLFSAEMLKTDRFLTFQFCKTEPIKIMFEGPIQQILLAIYY